MSEEFLTSNNYFDEGNIPLLRTTDNDPNPVNNVLTISADEDIQHINIYNVLSVKVMEMTINNKEAVLDLSNLESGMYLIEILGKNEKSIKTFIKQ